MQRTNNIMYCTKDCPDFCAFTASVAENGAVHFQPEEHTAGGTPFVCGKLARFHARESRDESHLSFISTADAIDAAAKLIRENSGEILYLRGSGSLGYFMSTWDMLFSRLPNVTFVEGNPCDETATIAHEEDFGVCANPPLDNLKKAKSIIIFGRNPRVTAPHLYAHLKMLKEQYHIPVILLDPVVSESAPVADRFIRINHGADGVLAAMLLAERGLAEGVDHEALLPVTGLTEEEYRYLSSHIHTGETAFITGMGLQRRKNGKNCVQWLNRLAHRTGCGDMHYYSRSSKAAFVPMKRQKTAEIPVSQVADALKAKRFSLIVIIGANPVVTYAEGNAWKEALGNTPSIVVDTNLCETSRLATVYLRVGGMFVQKDAGGSYFFRRSGLRSNALHMPEPPDTEVACMLATELGFETCEETMQRMQNITFEREDGVRSFQDKEIPLMMPAEIPAGMFRLMTGSHVASLNSQLTDELPEKARMLQMTPADAARLCVADGDAVRVTGDCGFFDVQVMLSDKCTDGTVYITKSVATLSGTPNDAIASVPTDAVYGFAYYDAAVRIEKLG